MAKVAVRLGINVQDVQEMMDLIRTLDPKPGRRYGSNDDVRYLVPDIIVEQLKGNMWFR